MIEAGSTCIHGAGSEDVNPAGGEWFGVKKACPNPRSHQVVGEDPRPERQHATGGLARLQLPRTRDEAQGCRQPLGPGLRSSVGAQFPQPSKEVEVQEPRPSKEVDAHGDSLHDLVGLQRCSTTKVEMFFKEVLSPYRTADAIRRGIV
jgi:hypothetical protein